MDPRGCTEPALNGPYGMKHDIFHDSRFFFATAPLPCPYLPGRIERRVVTELSGREAMSLNDRLSLAGFRRSHGICYAPACPDCNACVPVRIVAPEFHMTRSHRRIWRMNADIDADVRDPVATNEQFALFADYQAVRHGDGDMAKMDFLDYQALVEDTPVETELVEFRGADGLLAAVCVVDRVDNGLSAVYSFFDPEDRKRGLGSYIILWLVDRARAAGLDYVYLGFWIDGCDKMAYKARFQPLELLGADGWQLQDDLSPPMFTES